MTTSHAQPAVVDPSVAERLFNHLVMPLRLPQRQDDSPELIEVALVNRMIRATETMCKTHVVARSKRLWESILASLNNYKSMTEAGGRLEKSSVVSAFGRLTEGQYLLLNIQSQNAAVFIYLLNSEEVAFEVFETSAKSKDVLAAETVLKWDFPGSAVAVPLAVFRDPSFTRHLASFLEQASIEPTKSFASLTAKAGVMVTETRDTTDPSLISSMLVAMLEGVGRRISPTLLTKRIRDDVCWLDAERPWRRLPLWLALRVSLQRFLLFGLGGDRGRVEYKFFVCVVLAQLLGDSESLTAPGTIDRLVHLKAKICRRLVKLDIEETTESTNHYHYMFPLFGVHLDRTISQANDAVELRWQQFKTMTHRLILPISRHANNELHLSLQICGSYLHDVAARFRGGGEIHSFGMPTDGQSPGTSVVKLNQFSEPYFALAKTEDDLRNLFETAEHVPYDGGTLAAEEKCIDIATKLHGYLDQAPGYYQGNVEQRSMMLLIAMELWIAMDNIACHLYPLLKRFHPLLHPDMLDALHILHAQDMVRVCTVQSYLKTRVEGCTTHFTVFEDPCQGCFAERYYEESSDAPDLHNLRGRIEARAEEIRRQKYAEWTAKTQEYERLVRTVNELACVYVNAELDPLRRGIHDPNCPRCNMEERAGRMQMEIYENPLPAEEYMIRVVVFELFGLDAFQAYRDASWTIVSRLGCPVPEKGARPAICTLRDYHQLKGFANGASPTTVILASTTKPFLVTHYKKAKFPVGWDDVCKPNGLRYGYFDKVNLIWPGRRRRRRQQHPTFAHHCALALPAASPLASFVSNSLPMNTSTCCTRTSYESIASQPSCPSGVNVHEFLAFQTLLGGHARRWISLVSELGSSNLNFSTETSMILVTHLALLSGPSKAAADPLRVAHGIFRDTTFCETLTKQLMHRLDVLSSNWREVYMMEIIVTVALRMYTLSTLLCLSDVTASWALSLLERARSITSRWMKLLHGELQQASDPETAKRCSHYALWAALLCKRTFLVHHGKESTLDVESLPLFVEACMLLYNNHSDNTAAARPSSLKNAIVRDVKMMAQMKALIHRSIATQPQAFGRALDSAWPDSDGETREITDFEVDGTSYWVKLTVPARDRYSKDQTIRYNYMHGALLVDGMPMGRLPAEYQGHVVLGELFGSQSLLTYPSRMRGMQYSLNIVPDGHEVHIGFGFVEGRMIIRTCRKGTVYELIPREVFVKAGRYDLPSSLVLDHVHWLNLETKVLEIRPLSRPWGNSRSNWTLSLADGTCSRFRHRGGGPKDFLVDPHTPLFHRIARTFDGFEPRQYLVVYQPFDFSRKKPLRVDMPRLQLTFVVNKEQRLECLQLKAYVDKDQDAGTWYGLVSKMVLRSVDSDQKTILVPLGRLLATRAGDHINVRIEPSGTFGKFTVNEVLGRIDCAAETALIYKKAELHAYTSSALPDPLTGRTGCEEALHWLSSAISQPWSPITSQKHSQVLQSIASLTPRREYYPDTMRVMKKEAWNNDHHHLPCTMQHDAYSTLISQIIAKSNDLLQFQLPPGEPTPLPQPGDPHLNKRAWLRRHLTERESPFGPPPSADPESEQKKKYASRDKSSSSTSAAYCNVLETTTLIRARPCTIPNGENLARSLSQSLHIGGYGQAYDNRLLSDRLAVDFRRQWGGLVQFARDNHEDKYALMFMLAPMSFRCNMDMDLMRTIIAFAIFDELRQMPLPSRLEYERLQPGQMPQLKALLQLMEPFRTHLPVDDNMETLSSSSSRLGPNQRRKREIARLRHEQKAEADCEALAQHLLSQWPCLTPTVAEHFEASSSFIDLEGALRGIAPEWERLYHNAEFLNHLNRVEVLLRRRRSDDDKFNPPPTLLFIPSAELFPCPIRQSAVPSLGNDLMCLPNLRIPRSAARVVTRRKLDARHAQMGEIQVPANLPVAYRNSWPVYRRLDLPQMASRAKHTLSTPTGRLEGIQAEDFSPAARQPPLTAEDDRNLELAVSELSQIVDGLMDTPSTVKTRYGNELKQSLLAFRKAEHADHEYFQRLATVALDAQMLVDDVDANRRGICQALDASVSSRRLSLLKKGQLWPPITPVSLLEQLRSTSSRAFGSGMKEALVRFGMAITNLQRETRLNTYAKRGESGRYKEEEMNSQHLNWDPGEYPDWLLLEIESNLAIRPDQVEVALATISPESGSNSVLQMNMGQGKTSCIIPMAALVLANGSNLTRVSVPKALLQQTGQLLHSRLGGLLDRELRHVPFSRKTPTEPRMVKAYMSMHQYMLEKSGVMLCLPEHNLSFKLSGLQRLLDDKVVEAKNMVVAQSILDARCRDILDESDYTLAVRTQLIYPSGAQMAVDGHPHRWTAAEEVLKLVELHAESLSRSHGRSIEVVRRPTGGYPLIYFLRPDAEDELLRRLTHDICQGKGIGGVLHMEGLGTEDRAAVEEFISTARVRRSSIERVKAMCPDRLQVRKTVYLLRGLLVNRILVMCLKKRWNVQYGLHPGRDPMAVPFHAKGVPSDQSEWGHPDVAILLTCLAFYYDGVSRKQLHQALEHLLKSDDPSCEYDRWMEPAENIASALRDWNSINLDDEVQFEELWRCIRYNLVVVDYYLNSFVFPRHAKQFKIKLQSNSWDIPLFSTQTPTPAAKGKSKTSSPALTTGFSGTNDNRSMLPLNIRQHDLARLAHTNAEVLTYLLHRRNRNYVPIASRDGKRLSEEDFLWQLNKCKIGILIDAGAQILEMDNPTLVRKWLDIDLAAPAALYFKDNRPWILGRQGTTMPLIASTFADDLGKCLVYIDQAHTRGTDLKLPPDACGALTLGLGQTKDHTVQAAMRLRQLAKTQSVVFFAPPEVHQSILDLQQTKTHRMHEKIDSSDVISWLLANTCDGIEQLQPLYYAQGMDFCKRTNAAAEFPDFLRDKSQRAAYAAAIKQEEEQTLEHLYEPKTKAKSLALVAKNPHVAGFVTELNSRRLAFQDNGSAVHASALQEVEQEREVAFEVETVRQVKKPAYYQALTFPGLHRDLESFARTGRLPADSHVFTPVLQFISRTGLGRKFGVTKAGGASRLLVSAEFQRTVELTATKTNDNFLRPVNWILWSELTKTAIVVVPEEAEAILSILREGPVVKTYLLTYAAPVTRRMMHFNGLDYFSVPPLPEDWEAPSWLKVEVGLLAGRLYFEWDELKTVLEFLGISSRNGDTVADEPATGLTHLGLDAGSTSESQAERSQQSPQQHPTRKRRPTTDVFTKKPLQFLQEWLAMRRRGQDFAPTPMGFVVQGKQLEASQPFFQRIDTSAAAHGDAARFRPLRASTAVDGDDDELVVVESAGFHDGADSDSGSDDNGDDEKIEYLSEEYNSDDEYYDAQEEVGSSEPLSKRGPLETRGKKHHHHHHHQKGEPGEGHGRKKRQG